MSSRHGSQRPSETDRHPTERQNEYFIPGDGIMREVIQADICRYLGNDALVRPGNYQGRTGYFIRAYRNLTSEMISDLKEDSRRWASERSHLEQRYGYGQAPSYLSSNIHDERQQLGPTPGPMQTQQMPGQPQYGQPQYGQPYGSDRQGMNPQPYGAQQPTMQETYGQSYIYTTGPPNVTYPTSVSYSSYDSTYQQAPRTTNPYGETANTYGNTDDYTAPYYTSSIQTPVTAPTGFQGGTPQLQQQQQQQQQPGHPPRDSVGYASVDPRSGPTNRHGTDSRHNDRDRDRRRR